MTNLTIKVGDSLPGTSLLRFGENGPEAVDMRAKFKGRKVVLFGLPGAFTGTCTNAHLPSFMRTAEKFRAKGVDEIICVAVNDSHVMKAWGESTGAPDAGVTLLADPAAEFTTAIGMAFSVPAIGFFNRSKRYALYAEDGVIKVLNPETSRDGCEISGGEHLLAQI